MKTQQNAHVRKGRHAHVHELSLIIKPDPNLKLQLHTVMLYCCSQWEVVCCPRLCLHTTPGNNVTYNKETLIGLVTWGTAVVGQTSPQLYEELEIANFLMISTF